MSNIDQNTKAVPQAVSLAAMLAASRIEVKSLSIKQEKAATVFQDTSRKSTHNIAGEIYKLGVHLLAEKNAEEFKDLLVANKVETRATANQWVYVVELLLPGNETWKNRAPAFTLMRRLMVPTDEGAAFIAKFTMAVAKTKLPTYCDRFKDSDRKAIDGLMFVARVISTETHVSNDDYVKQAKAAEALDLSTITVPEKAEFVLLWAKVDDGKVIPMGLVPKGEATAKKAAIDAGRVLYERPASEVVEAVTEDVKGLVVFGDEVGVTSAPEVVLDQGSFPVEDATT